MSRCFWCNKRIWFWQKWEWTPTSHCEVGVIPAWVCSSNCWEAAANDDIVSFNIAVGAYKGLKQR